MPFDPTKPQNHTDLNADEVRNNLLALKSLLDNKLIAWPYVANKPVLWNPGNAALVLDGVTGQGLVPSNAAFDFGAADFTAVTCFASTVVPGDHSVLFAHDGKLYFDIRTTDIRIALNGANALGVNCPVNPFDGAFHCVAVKRTAGFLEANMDGIPLGGVSKPGAGGGNGALTFGHLPGGNNAQTLLGRMKNYSYWNRALSDAELASIASGTLALQGNENGLVGCWPMNDGLGNVFTDKTAAHRNGTLSGAYHWDVAPAVVAIPDPLNNPADVQALRDDLANNVLPQIRDAIQQIHQALLRFN